MSIINNRYSTRKFNDREVEGEKIKSILEAAMTAPSSKNKKPWEFIVVDNKKLLIELSSKHKDSKENKMRNMDKSKIHYNGWEKV
ncbi:MAG: nitroreductase family protein [Terrisporobacter sp.]|uniref:nitroreductase family protein n=1 Tax=Terrisporobacter sp. TaxID=1965305 RepID=UPI002FCB9226